MAPLETKFPLGKNDTFLCLFGREKIRSEDEKKKGSFCTEPRLLFLCPRKLKKSPKEFFLAQLLKIPEDFS